MLIPSGANDAVLSPAIVHVPLDRYKDNLRSMIHLLRSPESEYYSPDTAIVLMTPPPILADYWRRQHVNWALREGVANTAEEALKGSDRSAKVTASYAAGCVEVAENLGVQVVDVYSGLIRAAGGTTEDALLPFFTYCPILH